MPKVVASASRRLRAQCSIDAPVPQSSLLWNGPRKVSFEDGHQSSSNMSCQATAGNSSSTSSLSSSSSKSSLRRKAPSVCLVGLAEGSASEDCLSPMPSVQLPYDSSPSPSSPWGHFVDILVPADDEEPSDPGHKRRLRDAPQFAHPNDNDKSPPTFQPLSKRHKHFGSWSPLRPYGLQPRRQRRNHSEPPQLASFLPNFLLDGSAPVPLERTDVALTKEVEKALQRLQV